MNKAMLKAIKKYAARGWRMTSLPAGQKKEPDSGWVASASSDRKVIRRAFKSKPQGNLAIVTGRESGIFVLDIDRHSPDLDGPSSMNRLIGKFGPLPRTFTVRTPSGGYHFYFKWAKGVRNRRGMRPGLDVRADGGYVVAAPSRVDGLPYKICRDLPVARAPGWLIKVVRSTGKSKSTGRAIRLQIGERNDALFKRACSMAAQGFSADAMRAALVAENASNTVEPLDDAELGKILKSAGKYVHGSGRAPPTSTLSELMQEDLPALRWAVKGLIPEGICLLAGPPKAGKSWFGMQVGLAITSHGAIWSGRKREKLGDVLYLALEDNKRRVRRRVKQLRHAWPATDRFHFQTDWPRMDAGGVEELDAWLQRHPKTRLVIIDTLERIRARRTRNGSAYAQDYDVSIRLKPLIDKYQIGVLVMHHTRKEKAEDVLDAVSGTNGLAGGVDTLLILRRTRGEGEGNLFVTGRDIDEEDHIAMRFDPSDGAWRPTGEEVKPKQSEISEQRARILAFVQTQGPRGPKEIANGIGEKEGNVRRLLAKMRKQKQLFRLNGKYTHTQ